MVNGIFQEEALFAPLALGLMCAFTGVVLGAAFRTSPVHARAGFGARQPSVAT